MTAVAAHRIVSILLVLCATATGAVGCSALATPITLTLGVSDGDDSPEGRYAEHLAEEIAEISDGAITIAPTYDAGHIDEPTDLGPNQVVGTRVASGELDLGLVPSRAWDALGVTSLRAINGPFLITSDELTDEVVGSSELRSRLLSGLPAAGVVGIDLLPDALRHPIGYAHPILALEEYDGELFQSPDSETIAEMFDAFGASVTGGENDPVTQIGMETAYDVSDAAYATGNVTYFPKVLTIVANPKLHEGLSDGQRKMLADATARTREWAAKTRPTDAEDAADFCAAGGEISAVTQAQLDEIEAAAAPVTATLREDPLTSELIDEITALRARLDTRLPVLSCEDLVASSPDAEASALNGRYEVTVTRDEYLAAGVTDEVDIGKNVGTWNWTLEDGRARFTRLTPEGVADPAIGLTYTLAAGAFALRWTSNSKDWTTADVVVQPDGSLVFTDITDGNPSLQTVSEVLFGLHPWVRIGDP